MITPVFVEFIRYGGLSRNAFALDIQSITRVEDADWGRTLIYYNIGDEAHSVQVDEEYKSVMKKVDAALTDTKEG